MALRRNLVLIKGDETLKTQNLIINSLGTSTEAPRSGVIVAIGEKCQEVEVGMRVIFTKGTGLKHSSHDHGVLLDEEDQTLFLMSEDHLLAEIGKDCVISQL